MKYYLSNLFLCSLENQEKIDISSNLLSDLDGIGII